MTTILAHRDTLYADSRCTADNASFRTVKIHTLKPVYTEATLNKGNAIIACAGESRIEREFLKQLQNVDMYWTKLQFPPAWEDETEETDFAAIMITPQGIVHFDSTFTADVVDGLYFAIGSGQAAVLGAIEVQKITPTIGIDPIRAMMAALQVDKGMSGGPIQWMKLGEFQLHKESV